MLRNVSRYYDIFLVIYDFFRVITRKGTRYYEKISRYYDFFLVITTFFS